MRRGGHESEVGWEVDGGGERREEEDERDKDMCVCVRACVCLCANPNHGRMWAEG
jgi:hypothetical protein